jgi:hypothetical protein
LNIKNINDLPNPGVGNYYLNNNNNTFSYVLNSLSNLSGVNSNILNFNSLGQPGTSGFVLSSTSAGVLSWVA